MIAAAHMRNHHEEFDIAAWVQADDGGTDDLANLAGALGRPVKRRKPPDRARDVLVFLANNDRRWLLVFDNAWNTVAATWNTSIAAAERQAPLARPALEMTAYLAPETIPCSFFSVLDDSSTAGRTRVDNALFALHSCSLATRTGDQISVHRLLQNVIRDQLTGNAARARDQFAALLPVRKRVLGPEHPSTLATRDSLAHWTRELAGTPGKRKLI